MQFDLRSVRLFSLHRARQSPLCAKQRNFHSRGLHIVSSFSGNRVWKFRQKRVCNSMARTPEIRGDWQSDAEVVDDEAHLRETKHESP